MKVLPLETGSYLPHNVSESSLPASCYFQDARSLNLSWQHRHLLMTPMFASSQSQAPGMGGGGGTFGTWMPGQLRQTQALAFTPTQDMAGE